MFFVIVFAVSTFLILLGSCGGGESDDTNDVVTMEDPPPIQNEKELIDSVGISGDYPTYRLFSDTLSDESLDTFKLEQSYINNKPEYDIIIANYKYGLDRKSINKKIKSGVISRERFIEIGRYFFSNAIIDYVLKTIRKGDVEYDDLGKYTIALQAYEDAYKDIEILKEQTGIYELTYLELQSKIKIAKIAVMLESKGLKKNPQR